MSDQHLRSTMSICHGRKEESNVVIGRPQEIRAEDSSKRLSSHLIVLLKVGNPKKKIVNKTRHSYLYITGLLVQVFHKPLEKIKMDTRQLMHNVP